MATRSTVSVVHSDGSVSQVYCHWDGYVQYNGQVLERFYNTRELAEELVSFGDASSLGSTVGEKHDFNARAEYGDDNIATQCTFYGRDRGETRTEARHFADIAEYEKNVQLEQFNYLFIEGDWYFKEGSNGVINRVADVLAEQQEKTEA